MLLTTYQTATLLSVSPRTLEGWRLTGAGPSYTKAGRRVLYCEQRVLDWLEKRYRHSTSEELGDDR